MDVDTAHAQVAFDGRGDVSVDGRQDLRGKLDHVQLLDRALRRRIEPPHPVQHIAEEIKPHRPALARRIDVDDAAPNRITGMTIRRGPVQTAITPAARPCKGQIISQPIIHPSLKFRLPHGKELRAVIRLQPDRQLRANWRGAPVLIAEGALAASGLVRQSSRLEYEYRVRTPDDADRWKQDFFAAFPDTEWEVRTFMERSERVAQRLAQVASGLMIIGLSTLFIGGLGVFNSVQAYLQRKLGTIATLRAVEQRD